MLAFDTCDVTHSGLMMWIFLTAMYTSISLSDIIRLMVSQTAQNNPLFVAPFLHGRKHPAVIFQSVWCCIIINNTKTKQNMLKRWKKEDVSKALHCFYYDSLVNCILNCGRAFTNNKHSQVNIEAETFVNTFKPTVTRFALYQRIVYSRGQKHYLVNKL